MVIQEGAATRVMSTRSPDTIPSTKDFAGAFFSVGTNAMVTFFDPLLSRFIQDRSHKSLLDPASEHAATHQERLDVPGRSLLLHKSECGDAVVAETVGDPSVENGMLRRIHVGAEFFLRERSLVGIKLIRLFRQLRQSREGRSRRSFSPTAQARAYAKSPPCR